MDTDTNTTLSGFDEIFADGSFHLRSWRDLLNRATKDLSADCEAICPFGFEVFDDKRFLSRDLKRFYILLRVLPEDAGSSDEIAFEFIDELRHRLAAQAPLFYQSVGIWRANRVTLPGRSGELSRGIDGMRMVNVLCRITRKPALEDYGRYVIAAVDGILDRTLGEAASFEQSTRARRRLFQLFQILDRSFHQVFFTKLTTQRLHPRALYENELLDFQRGRENQPVTHEEIESLNHVVLPALRNLSALLKTPLSPEDPVQELQVADCYSDHFLKLRGSTMRIARLVDFIESSYRSYV